MKSDDGDGKTEIKEEKRGGDHQNLPLFGGLIVGRQSKEGSHG